MNLSIQDNFSRALPSAILDLTMLQMNAGSSVSFQSFPVWKASDVNMKDEQVSAKCLIRDQ